MSDSRSDDERFAELIDREFGEQVPPAPPPADLRFRVWEVPEEPDEPFVPAPAPPLGGWHPLTTLGAALIGFGILMMVLAASGVVLPTLVAVAAGAAVFAGTTLLLYRLAKRGPHDSDGAVV